MKLICLNTWGGKIYKPLIKFIRKNSKDTDIFCLQEIYDTTSDIRLPKSIRTNLLAEIIRVLPNFNVFYFPTLLNYNTDIKPYKVSFNLKYGSATFVKNNIKVNAHQDYFIYRDENPGILKNDFSNLATPLQYIGVNLNGKDFAILNFHGISYPFDKLDSPNRLEEARKVIDIMESKKGAKIITGDFNLLPDTKCI